MTSDLTTQLSAVVAAQRVTREELLAALVRQPSDNPPGDCVPFADHAALLLERLGLTVERHPVPTEVVRAHGMRSATNLIIRHRFGPGPTIALNAHGDVVPPGGGWTTAPYGAEVRDGWMYGRGVAVSKSDFATYASALLALIQCKASLAGTVELHFTMDEEAGGEIGPRWMLAQGLTKPDYAICAGFTYSVTAAHDGCLHLEVIVEGKSAHAASPASGVDALAGATKILGALYRFAETLRGRKSGVSGIESASLVVGLIEGGINTNVVPDRVRFTIDRRIIPEEHAGAAEQELRDVIAKDAAAPLKVTVRRLLLAKPLAALPGQEKLIGAVQRAAKRVLGEDIPISGVPLYTDARHYAEAGVPVILYGAGPRTILEANAHRADERLPLVDLHRASEIVALAVADLLLPD